MDMKKAVKRARDYVTSIGFLILIRIMRWADYPRASVWGARVGRLIYYVASKNRRRALENLSRVFGDERTPNQLKELFISLLKKLNQSFFCLWNAQDQPQNKLYLLKVKRSSNPCSILDSNIENRLVTIFEEAKNPFRWFEYLVRMLLPIILFLFKPVFSAPPLSQRET